MLILLCIVVSRGYILISISLLKEKWSVTSVFIIAVFRLAITYVNYFNFIFKLKSLFYLNRNIHKMDKKVIAGLVVAGIVSALLVVILVSMSFADIDYYEVSTLLLYTWALHAVVCE